jgi:uncharacterized protein (DUF1800 family)
MLGWGKSFMTDQSTDRQEHRAVTRRSAAPAPPRGVEVAEPADPADPAGDSGDDAEGRLDRRRLIAGLAGAGAAGAAWYVAAKGLPDNTTGWRDLVGPWGSPDRAAASRPSDGGGFGNRDESYANSLGSNQTSATTSPGPTLLFPTAGEAAAATQVTVPTILATDDPVLHLLRRATFGPTPALVDEVHTKGIDAWLDEQLAPQALADPTAERAWASFPLASMDSAGIRASIQPTHWDAAGAYSHATLAGQIWSNRQLYEVMVDFWANHLNVPTPGPGSWDVGGPYHNDVIRRHAFGSFTDMLLAAMSHPAMLRYLTNTDSKKDSVNENLGRELLELHTVGVGSGYTETDVRNSAYILTGRTQTPELGPGPVSTFLYDPKLHWTGPVQVLDFYHDNATPEGGLEVGDAYIRHLAAHPATAQTIARKVAVRFVADVPPQPLVDRLATAYLDGGTAVVPVLQTLFRSAEFWAAVGQKTRRPLENVVATARVLGVEPGDDTPRGVGATAHWTVQMGHRPLMWPAPNGYPDVHAAWRSASSVLGAWNSHRGLVQGWTPGLVYPDPAQLVAGRPQATVGEYVDSLCQRLCFQTFQAPHRDALVAFVGVDQATPTEQSELPDLVEHLAPLVLDSPYFALR